MSTDESTFRESGPSSAPIRELKLAIERLGAWSRSWPSSSTKLRGRAIVRSSVPRFPYLSTEWGVPYDTIAIAIPFYLAPRRIDRPHRPESAGLQSGASGGPPDLLRYLRHTRVGHVVNYRLPDSTSRRSGSRQFGRMSEPYREEYRPEPFSRRFVRHLPRIWYAQKHPDED